MAFSVVGDISKAHRRFKHREEEHGYLGCQIDASEEIQGDPDSQTVYVNKVLTFGVSGASYWWARISAAGIRATHNLLGPEFMLELPLYADDLESLGLGSSGLWKKGIPLSYCYMSLLGFPFKWAKTREGFRVKWLGMETEYNSYRLGTRRADWLVNWLWETVRAGSVHSPGYVQVLGRLGFAAIALDWEKPFLGPLYAWSSVSPQLSRESPDLLSFSSSIQMLRPRMGGPVDRRLQRALVLTIS